MNQTSQEPIQATSKSLSDAEVRYYYFGLYKVLRRHRMITIIGWIVVVIGCLSFPVGWSLGRSGGIVDIVLSLATVMAGLTLVAQSVSSLDAYIRIVLPVAHNGEQHPMIHEVLEIMKNVDDGGWQEAYAAIQKLEELGLKYGLPALK